MKTNSLGYSNKTSKIVYKTCWNKGVFNVKGDVRFKDDTPRSCLDWHGKSIILVIVVGSLHVEHVEFSTNSTYVHIQK